MHDRLQDILNSWHAGAGALTTPLICLAILALGLGAHFVLVRVVVRIIAALARRTRVTWDKMLVKRGVFHRLAALAPGLLVRALAGGWLPTGSATQSVMLVAANLWVLVAVMLTLYALLDGVSEIYNTKPYSRQMPIRGFVQGIKLVALIVVLVVALAMLMGKSPALLVSGLGAMTAVLMLIFKDPIMGFVAGIQLSANRMLAVGDWLEMPKYQADGDVIEVTLTTVKVRNWDQTVTTVPTYALISDSFKNWRGMQEAGGRRIMRNVFIDVHSIRFLSETDIDRLRKAQLISSYINEKLADIEKHNREHNVDPASPVNGRHLTNIGTFRAYLMAYLKAHPGIHKNLIMMVRQLQPTAEGLPIQLYAFTGDTAWVAHEAVQSDIFDHILAVAPEFGLRVFQAPSGSDVRELAGRNMGGRPSIQERGVIKDKGSL